ncbi:hypothetical protein DXX93_18775 [Thalassotalea euphylliae]|uniref:Uncharacterized protein n=1 Tax=Thalassotalea euphylliae TaxID=1655234 RepID=A0A3E0TWN5_9GAMM|nr:hypothetical protein [Thalassotalea euphylliae]REL28405.1 hypothetical protein DXX93_18775 [Thalassotalea euphylliae]
MNEAVTNSDEACVERLSYLFSTLDHTELQGTKTIGLLEQLADGNIDAYTQIKELLLSDPNELNKLLLAAKQHDADNPESQIFQEISSVLIDIDPSFGEKIRQFEEKYSMSKSLETSYLLSLSGSKIQRE